MENTEIMNNNEVMENVNDVVYDVIPVPAHNAKDVLAKIGIGAAVIAGCYGIYVGGKKLVHMYRAKKAMEDSFEDSSEDETEESYEQ